MKRRSINVPIVTEWRSYTPTFGAGFGTVINITFYSRRFGDTLDVTGVFTTGTVAGDTASISIGFSGGNGNVTIDTSKVTSLGLIGSAQSSLASATHFCVFPIVSSGTLTTISFAVQNSTTGFGSGAALGNVIAADGSKMSVSFRVPILGWKSTRTV